MILAENNERNRFLRFAIVGAIGFVVDFGVFNLVISLTPIRAVWASVLSFLAAVVSNFTWNRFWTYPDSRSKAFGRQFVQFIVVSLIGLAIRTPLFAWIEPLLINLTEDILPSQFFLTPIVVGHNFTLVIVVLVVMMWNFFANRYWTYNDVDKNHTG